MKLMPVSSVAHEAMTPAFQTYGESIVCMIAVGVTIVILSDLLGFFIRITLFRKFEEVNIVHNHNITLQVPEMNESKRDASKTA